MLKVKYTIVGFGLLWLIIVLVLALIVMFPFWGCYKIGESFCTYKDELKKNKQTAQD